jgi:hypothetical protein
MSVQFEATKSLTISLLGNNFYLVCQGYQEDMSGPPSRVDTMKVYHNGVLESHVNSWNFCGDTIQEIEDSYLYKFLRIKGIGDKEAVKTCIEVEKQVMNIVVELFPES